MFRLGSLGQWPIHWPSSELDNFKSYRSHCSHRCVPLCTRCGTAVTRPHTMDPATQLRRQPSGPITATLTRGSSTRQPALVSSGANADASQYFSIETRLELKTRLTTLQLQLRQLLVQAKLAWMRCFVEPRTSVSRAAALQMVQLGEGLTASLSRAFDLAAGTATAPLAEYQALVKRVECEMATFQNLVTNVAHGNYPHVEDQSDEDEEDDCKGEESEEEARVKPMTYLNRPVNVDLPSMQTYCKHVAPPYSSYLPKTKTHKHHP
ncbi:hypothetical protein F442_07519 [Phytophthora nicotianae P10297]|uniref:Uncharacterized protein n=4 Tax=Phytophthora nicotianae TaxID=4792 RepID=W2QCZ2_PHYN3|nr:hypothetical protein PPTG_10513 [Phytophthora nicotianae INRA-310]ETM48193.1 hypothetical protein L914_07227 [Phytophthora nicotianae]ETN10374.1 hypothetical protein PPTG_10513 [Phytophthora nicotianae INRA-310]ETO77244.1 hypothetical protein F444_07523 [Phytophthora nicotianae P1976]ETP46190.1 hypothetical protein F442_07519 [Phytophthora nicotianae P10297]